MPRNAIGKDRLWLLNVGHVLFSVGAATWAAGRSWPDLAEMVFFAVVCGQAGLLGVLARHERRSIGGQAAALLAGVACLAALLAFNNSSDYASDARLEFVLLLALFLVVVPALAVWAVLATGRAVLRRERVRAVFSESGSVQFSLRQILGGVLLAATLLAMARLAVERLGDSYAFVLTLLLFGLASAAITLVSCWLSLTQGWTLPRLLIAVTLVLLIVFGPPTVFRLLGVTIRTADVYLWAAMLGFQAAPAAATLEILGFLGYRITVPRREVGRNADSRSLEAQLPVSG